MNTAKLRLAVLSNKTVKSAVRRICESLLEMADNIPDHNLSIISIEKLEPYTSDIAVRSFIANEKRISTLKDMGISESVNRILQESSISKYPHLRNPIGQFRNVSGQSADYIIAENYMNSLKNLLWDPVIKREYDLLESKISGLREEILVKKHADIISASKNRIIYKPLLEKLDNYVYDLSSGSRKMIIQELDKYKFDSTINRLANGLRMLENENGNFNPLSNDSKCSIKSAIGFVKINEKCDYFLLDGVIYRKEGQSFSYVKESEALKECSDLVEIHGAMSRTGAYILEDSIMVPMGSTTIRLTDDGSIYVNEEKISRDQLTHRVNMASIVDRSQVKNLYDALTLNLHAQKLMDIDFAKTIKSNIFEGVRINIVKGKNYLVNFRNGAMNESRCLDFISARKLRNFVMEKLSYDISEAFSEVLTKEEAGIQKQKDVISKIFENLVKIEREHKKVKAAMESDEAVNENKHIQMLFKSLDSELNILKKTYNSAQLKLNEMMSFVPIPAVGDKVKVGKKGNGTVLSVDGVNKQFTVMLENGSTCRCNGNEISILDPVVKKSRVASAEAAIDAIKGSKATPLDTKSMKGAKKLKESFMETEFDEVEEVSPEEVEGLYNDPSAVMKHPDFGTVYDTDEENFEERVQRGFGDYSPEEDEELYPSEDEYGMDSETEEYAEDFAAEEDEFGTPLEERPFDEEGEMEESIVFYDEHETEPNHTMYDDDTSVEDQEFNYDEMEREEAEEGDDYGYKSLDDINDDEIEIEDTVQPFSYDDEEYDEYDGAYENYSEGDETMNDEGEEISDFGTEAAEDVDDDDEYGEEENEDLEGSGSGMIEEE